MTDPYNRLANRTPIKYLTPGHEKIKDITDSMLAIIPDPNPYMVFMSKLEPNEIETWIQRGPLAPLLLPDETPLCTEPSHPGWDGLRVGRAKLTSVGVRASGIDVDQDNVNHGARLPIPTPTGWARNATIKFGYEDPENEFYCADQTLSIHAYDEESEIILRRHAFDPMSEHSDIHHEHEQPANDAQITCFVGLVTVLFANR